MTDEERAELLARAIDDLIRGIESPDAPHGLEDDEVESLLDVARDHLECSRAAQNEGAGYETDVWDRLKDRLNQPQPPPDIDLPRDQHDALSDIISLRMRMAREVLDIAESHRDEIWARLQSRIGPSLDGAAAPSAYDIPIDVPDDSDIEAITRRSLARLAEIASDPVNIRFRERLKRDLTALQPPQPTTLPARRLNIRIAVAAAALITIAGIGLAPLPFTGVSDHPAVQIAQSLTGHSGPEGASAAP